MPDQREKSDAERLREAMKQMNGQSMRANNEFVDFVLKLAEKVEELDRRTARRVVRV